MFEASAPKYKFGGSSEKLDGSNEKTKQTDPNRRGPVIRPSQKASEEREWVVNAINKYFDVIVEEEEEEEEDDEEINEEDDELDSEIDSEDEELESISDTDYQDSDE